VINVNIFNSTLLGEGGGDYEKEYSCKNAENYGWPLNPNVTLCVGRSKEFQGIHI